jgi:ATP-dependent DNA helicase RecQ
LAGRELTTTPEEKGAARSGGPRPGPGLAVPRERAGSAAGQAARRLGIDRLHPEQQQVIDAALDGRDVLMVLPTGFGKSACYQIPSMLLARPVVVASPLRALLRDQQQKLERRDVPCVRIDGTIRGRARTEALERISAGGPLLVMTTPETLAARELLDALATSGVGLAAVDEAHCISEWGHDFRPSYSRIGAVLGELGSPPVLALTATATERVRSTITSSLGMRDPIVVAASPHRSNLAFDVVPCEGDQRLRALVRLIKRLRRPGIVYCATRRETDAVYVVLRRFGVPSYRYHGKMSSTDRDAEQKRFMKPRHRAVMVATNAFGLGIDKRDLRFVLHYQAPASLEQYVQEAGRAGRDGGKANCILLADPADRAIHQALQARSRIRADQLFRMGNALAAWAGEGREPTVNALAVSAQLGPRIAAALVAKLEEADIVAVDEATVRVRVPASEIEERSRSLAGQFETIRVQDGRRLDSIGDYVAAKRCRSEFLRAYFGEDADDPCGLCDNCRDSTRSAGFFSPLKAPEPPRRRGSPGERGGRNDRNDEKEGGHRRRRRRRRRKRAAT